MMQVSKRGWKIEGNQRCDAENCNGKKEYVYWDNDKDINMCSVHFFQKVKFDNRYMQDKLVSNVNKTEMNGMTDMKTQQIGLVVSLPRGVKEANFADSVGRLLPKKGKNGSVITTRNGEPVLSIALDIDNLKAMMEKHNLNNTDKRTGHKIVWCTGFISEIRTGKGTASKSF